MASNFSQVLRRSVANVSNSSDMKILCQEEKDVLKTLEKLSKEKTEGMRASSLAVSNANQPRNILQSGERMIWRIYQFVFFPEYHSVHVKGYHLEAVGSVRPS